MALVAKINNLIMLTWWIIHFPIKISCIKKDFLTQNPVHQVFQKPVISNQIPRIHGKIGHYQADLTFLTRYKKQYSNYHILLNVINVNTKFAYIEALRDKTQYSVLNALESLDKKR